MIVAQLIKYSELLKIPLNRRDKYIYEVLKNKGFILSETGMKNIIKIRLKEGCFFQQKVK